MNDRRNKGFGTELYSQGLAMSSTDSQGLALTELYSLGLAPTELYSQGLALSSTHNLSI